MPLVHILHSTVNITAYCKHIINIWRVQYLTENKQVGVDLNLLIPEYDYFCTYFDGI